MPYHNGYPIGRCPGCGHAQGGMGLCRICWEKETGKETRNNWEYEDDCNCPKIGKLKWHHSWCKNKIVI